MSDFFNPVLCLKAYKLSKREGIDGPTLAKELGVKYATDARHLAALGARYAQVEAAKLTAAEETLLHCLAAEHRAEIARGQVCSPKGKYVSGRARKSAGWAASVAAKRLCNHRKGEDERYYGTGLRLVSASRNGYMNLTDAGWAYIHAVEAAS